MHKVAKMVTYNNVVQRNIGMLNPWVLISRQGHLA